MPLNLNESISIREADRVVSARLVARSRRTALARLEGVFAFSVELEPRALVAEVEADGGRYRVRTSVVVKLDVAELPGDGLDEGVAALADVDEADSRSGDDSGEKGDECEEQTHGGCGEHRARV